MSRGHTLFSRFLLVEPLSAYAEITPSTC